MNEPTKDDLRKIRNRLRSYERKVRREKAKLGCYDDSGGRRYHIGPHYQLLGDDAGALGALAWFERVRLIEIARALNTTPPGPERTRLVEEIGRLRR